MLDAIDTLSSRWPWMSTQETCILLLSLETQWVLNCDHAPSSQFARPQEDFRGRPVFARTSTTLSAGGSEVPSADFVRAVPATASVPDAKGRALVMGEDAFIVASSIDTLVGTHPAFPESTTTEERMSIFVHEFFHTRQLLAPSFAETRGAPRKRYPNNRVAPDNSRRRQPSPTAHAFWLSIDTEPRPQ